MGNSETIDTLKKKNVNHSENSTLLNSIFRNFYR